MLYVEADLGRLVALLVKNFDKVQGKTIKAFDRCYSGMEMVQIIQKVSLLLVNFATKLTTRLLGNWKDCQIRD